MTSRVRVIGMTKPIVLDLPTPEDLIVYQARVSAPQNQQKMLAGFGTLYPDLIADGFIGPRTISALKSYLARRGKEGELVMLRALNCSQGQRYLELAEQRSANETFVYGWIKERVVI